MELTKARLTEKFNLLNIDELNTLNSVASTKDKQICNNFIDEWRKQGLKYGFFGTKCNNIYNRRRVTYNEILELYIYWCFMMYELDVNEREKQTYRELANYYYMEGQKEVGRKPKELPNALFLALLGTPCVNGYTLDEYKGSKALQSTYQIHRQAVMQIQQGQKPDVNKMDRELEKEQTERLSIRVLKTGIKICGIIDMLAIGINNMAKIEGIKEATKDLPIENQQVRFIAVMDERTTKMCKSLDGQLFNVHAKNTFTRYSDSDKGMRTYTCDGLVQGLNLPPITNHFHWCRSTIIYNINKPKSEWYDKYVEMKTRNNKEL